MGFARQVLLAVLTVAVGAYASDCGGMTTPEQAMQCCNSMRCSSHGHHGQECCKTMPSMHVAIGQPTTVHSISSPPLVYGAVQLRAECQRIEFSGELITDHSHDPPTCCSPPVLPLRI